jgi:hypothetical protein
MSLLRFFSRKNKSNKLPEKTALSEKTIVENGRLIYDDNELGRFLFKCERTFWENDMMALSTVQQKGLVVLISIFIEDNNNFVCGKFYIYDFFNTLYRFTEKQLQHYQTLKPKDVMMSFSQHSDNIRAAIVLIVHCMLYIDGEPQRDKFQTAINFFKLIGIDYHTYLNIINAESQKGNKYIRIEHVIKR